MVERGVAVERRWGGFLGYRSEVKRVCKSRGLGGGSVVGLLGVRVIRGKREVKGSGG